MQIPMRSQLGFKAVLFVAIPMLIILTIIGVVEGALAYRAANAHLEIDVRNALADDLEHISAYLWQSDRGAIQEKLDALVKFGPIIGARVTDETGFIIQAGSLGQESSAYFLSETLVYEQTQGPVTVGTLMLEATRDRVWDLARTQVVNFVAIAAAAVLIATFLIKRFLDRNVLAPITKIAKELRSRPADGQDLAIDLDHAAQTDELKQLVNAIHEMRGSLLTSQNETRISQKETLASQGETLTSQQETLTSQGETLTSQQETLTSRMETRTSQQETLTSQRETLTSQNENIHNQKQLVQAAQLAGLGYATADTRTNRLLDCDEKYAAMHGKTVDEMLKLSFRANITEELGHPEDVGPVVEFEERMLRGEKSALTARVRVGEGQYRHVKKIFSAKFWPDDAKGIVDVVAQDVTEFHQMKDQLLQTQKMEAIGNLTGGIAHDFNNILAIISGNLELIRGEANKKLLTGFVKTALTAVNRGATLTQHLLAFARKQTLLPEVIDVAQLVRDSASFIQTSIGETIEFSFVAQDAPWQAVADRAQLEAVLLNLVVNARDAMPGGGSLAIKVQNTNLDDDYTAGTQDVVGGEYVCISVADSGEGMSAETVERAIEPFFTTKDVGKGTGLGLSMAFGFAKQSGGHLNIYSELGHGTTIRLYLPRVRAIGTAKANPAILSSAVSLQGLQVLLVEDDEDLRRTVGAQIRSLGCVVRSAADGKSAVALAQELPHIDILLSDIMLPGAMDGFTVAENVASIFPGCAIVNMSGFADTVILGKDLSDDDRLVLRKPFSLFDLQQALTLALAACPR